MQYDRLMNNDNLEERNAELRRLEAKTSRLESLILTASPEARRILESALQTASLEIATVRKDIRETEMRHKEAVVAAMVERETQLSREEKETYGELLAKDFFAKEDFNRLETFYANTWDRLSEDGKDQMSLRVWAGVRRGEYSFTELPTVVQEKEAGRIYDAFSKGSSSIVDPRKIPTRDKEDFMRAYESEHREDSFKILERDSFRQTVGLKVLDRRGQRPAEAEERLLVAAENPEIRQLPGLANLKVEDAPNDISAPLVAAKAPSESVDRSV